MKNKFISFTGLKEEYKNIKKNIFTDYDNIFSNSEFILRKKVKEFELKIAKYIGTKFAIGLNSGTDALLMGVHCAGIKKKDEVITVSHTYVASIAAIVHVGATPIFVDIKDDYNIDPTQIEKKINKRTKGIMVVHLNGRSCDMAPIVKIAKKYNLTIIEDCAQALGTKYKSRHVGTFGKVGCFSLHPMKILNIPGDGGFLTTNSKNIYKKISLLRDHGQEIPKTKNKIVCYGFNSRLDNIHAAVALIKLKKLNSVILTKRKIAKYYIKYLSKIKEIELPNFNDKIYYDTFNSFVIKVKNRTQLKKYLYKCRIETFSHYSVGVHMQKEIYTKKIKLKKTEEIQKKIVSLPIHASLKINELNYIINCIKKFYNYG